MRQSEGSKLERELAHRRSAAPDALVSTLVDRIEVSSNRARTRRIGALLAATGVAVVVLGASGGGIYAYSSSTPTKKSSGVHINQTGTVQRPSSSAGAQYGPVTVPPYPPPRPQPPPPPPPPPPFKPPPSSGGGNSGGGTSGGQGSGGGGSQGSGSGQSGGGVAGGSGNGSQGSGGELPFTGLSLVVP